MFAALVISALLAFPAAGETIPDGYSVVQSEQVTTSDEAPVRIEVLLDARLTSELQKQLWGNGPWDFVLDPQSAAYKSFKEQPPLPAIVHCLGLPGDKLNLAELGFKSPLLKLERVPWKSEHPEFLVTEDLSAGFGSYSGLATRIFQPSKDCLEGVTAFEPTSKSQESLILVRSPKMDWRIPNKRKPEILFVSSHPGSELSSTGPLFVIEYVRYAFDGRQWIVHRLTSIGIWESDQAFPRREMFP